MYRSHQGFSVTQLNRARMAIKNGQRYNIKCSSCNGQQIVEIECSFCGKTKGLEGFAKCQRSKSDSAVRTTGLLFDLLLPLHRNATNAPKSRKALIRSMRTNMTPQRVPLLPSRNPMELGRSTGMIVALRQILLNMAMRMTPDTMVVSHSP